MTLQGSGPIKMSEIAAEMGETGGDYSLNDLSAAVNPAASPRPDGVAPHSMSEFYGYNHLANGSPSLTPTRTPTITPSVTPTLTPSVTRFASPSVTPSITPSITITPSVTPSITRTPSVTPTPSASPCFADFPTNLSVATSTDCTELPAATLFYSNSSPVQIGSRIYTSLGCAGIVNGLRSDGAKVFTIVDSLVTNSENCVSTPPCPPAGTTICNGLDLTHADGACGGVVCPNHVFCGGTELCE